MLTTLRQALTLVDAWTRRRVAISAGLAIALALIEMAAFALLYALVQIVSNNDIPGPAGAGLTFAGITSQSDMILALGIVVIIIMLLKSACAIAVSRWQAKVQNTSESRLVSRMFADYLTQSYLFHVERNSATLIRNLTSSAGVVATSVVGGLSSLITDAAVLLGTLVVLALIAPWLAAGLALFAALVLGGYVWVLGPHIHRASATDQRLTAATIQSLNEAFAGVKSVHVFNVVGAVAESFHIQRDLLARSRASLSFMQRLPQYYLEICLVLGAATATLVLSGLVGQKRAFALLGLLIVAAFRVLPSVARILGALNGMRSGRPAVHLLLDEAMRIPRRSPSSGLSSASEATRSAAFIEMADVSFRYPARAQDVLSDVNFAIERGQMIGIVGASGSGKTTLVDLVLGLLNPTSGCVFVEGVPLTGLTVEGWRRRVGYVPQDTYLLDGDVFTNVMFHRSLPAGADAEALVWKALELAQLKETVQLLPGQLGAQIGERGVRLSGGQRQRLGLARALLLEPSVLVLDEATSALDSATEGAISSTIANLRGAMTVIVVAHRLSTVRKADGLILLEAGRIAATGSLKDLAERSPAFAANLRMAGERFSSNEAPQ